MQFDLASMCQTVWHISGILTALTAMWPDDDFSAFPAFPTTFPPPGHVYSSLVYILCRLNYSMQENILARCSTRSSEESQQIDLRHPTFRLLLFFLIFWPRRLERSTRTFEAKVAPSICQET